MSCRIDFPDIAVFVSHHPISVITSTLEHADRLKKKPDGHYDREDLITLAREGHAVLYDEKAVRAIARAAEFLIHGCPPY
jgi:hypothetical protein